jgi:hypothetical protein
VLTASVLLCSIGTTDCRQVAESTDQRESPFMCLQYGMEEVAKHPVHAGKFVKVERVQKGAPQIIEFE